MSIHDAELSDIYVDENGKLWRCVMTCAEPTVTFEAVEGYLQSPPSPYQNVHGVAQIGLSSPQPSLVHPRKSGGVSGAMWNGWKRIYRKDASPLTAAER